MKRKVLSVFLSLITIISVIGTTSMAVETKDSLKEKTNSAKQELDNVKGEINSTMQEIEDLNSSITDLEKDLDNINKEITSLTESISEKENDLEEKQLLLDERLSAAYMKQSNTYLDALFSGGFLNFVSNYDMIKQIAEYDTNLIEEVREVKKNLEDEKTKLEESKAEKEQKTKEVKDLKSQKESRVSSLTDEQKAIQAQIDEYDSQMKALEAKEKELARQQAAAKSSSSKSGASNSSYSTAGSGNFMWPVPSSRTITSQYGYRIHPISGTRKLHAGVDIGASGGSDIVASASGTVYLASYGYNGGYGNYIIIDHGNGYTTRYAHCSALYVSAGQQVSKGQTIAAVGSTGASTGNHCHFEVRINGESQNPLNYV